TLACDRLVTGRGAGLADLGAEAAMGMALRMPVAFLRAAPAGLGASPEDRADIRLLGRGPAPRNSAGRPTDLGVFRVKAWHALSSRAKGNGTCRRRLSIGDQFTEVAMVSRRVSPAASRAKAKPSRKGSGRKEAGLKWSGEVT